MGQERVDAEKGHVMSCIFISSPLGVIVSRGILYLGLGVVFVGFQPY